MCSINVISACTYIIFLLVARLVDIAPEVRRQAAKLLSIRPTLCSFVKIWTRIKNKKDLSKSHLVNQAKVRDGKKEENEADKQNPEKVSADGINVHPTNTVSADGSVPPENAMLTGRCS